MQTKRNMQHPLILIRDIEEQHSWIQFWKLNGLFYIKHPVLQIFPQKLIDIEQIIYKYDFFIFTSRHAVKIFLEQVSSDAATKELQRKPKICVGKFTAEILIQKKYQNVCIPPQGEGVDQIILHLKNSALATKHGIFLCGNSASSLLEKSLFKLNISVARREIYKVTPLNSPHSQFVIDCLQLGTYSYVLFCSGLSVKIFQQQFESKVRLDSLRILCMGNSARSVLKEYQIHHFTYFSMRDDIASKVLDHVDAFVG